MHAGHDELALLSTDEWWAKANFEEGRLGLLVNELEVMQLDRKVLRVKPNSIYFQMGGVEGFVLVSFSLTCSEKTWKSSVSHTLLVAKLLFGMGPRARTKTLEQCTQSFSTKEHDRFAVSEPTTTCLLLRIGHYLRKIKLEKSQHGDVFAAYQNGAFVYINK